MAKKPNCAGIILSGGQNTRMDGRNKSFLKLGSKRFLDLIFEAMSPLFDEIIIVTRQPEIYQEWDVIVTKDLFEIHSPLAGIHAGLHRMQSEYAFVTSCDTPFLKKEVIQILIDAIEPQKDVIVPSFNTYFQPLCAIYSKKCRLLIEQLLRQQQVKVDQLFAQSNIKQIDYSRIKTGEPKLHSVFNVDTQEEMVKAQILIKKLSVKK